MKPIPNIIYCVSMLFVCYNFIKLLYLKMYLIRKLFPLFFIHNSSW